MENHHRRRATIQQVWLSECNGWIVVVVEDKSCGVGLLPADVCVIVCVSGLGVERYVLRWTRPLLALKDRIFTCRV
jgi:hypothetical protein